MFKAYFFVLFQIYLVEAYLKGKAQLTYYHAFSAACCEENPAYNRSISNEECFVWLPW